LKCQLVSYATSLSCLQSKYQILCVEKNAIYYILVTEKNYRTENFRQNYIMVSRGIYILEAMSRLIGLFGILRWPFGSLFIQ